MGKPADRAKRLWRFRLNDGTILEVSAPEGPTEKQVRRRGRVSLVFGTLIAAVIAVGVAFADNVQADGDTATAGIQPLSLGTVCSGVDSNTDTAYIRAIRSGNYGTAGVFLKDQTMTVSVASATTGLSASFSDADLAIPSNWDTVSNSTPTTDTAMADVKLNTTTVGAFAGTITFKVTGKRSSDSAVIDTNTQALGVSATVEDCAPTNQPPVADAGDDVSGDEGSAIQLDGSGSYDPDGDPLTYSWQISNATLCSFDDSTSVAPKLTCTDNGSFTATLTVDDGQGASDTDTATVTVNNVAPEVTITGGLTSVNEGDAATLYSYTWTDPGSSDTWDKTTSCGTTGVKSDESFDQAAKSGSFKCAWADDSPTITASDNEDVSITVTDDDLGSDTKKRTVTVDNVAPTIQTFVCAAAPIAVGVSAAFTGTFTDPGTLDTHTASFDWDDGTATGSGPAGGGNFSGGHPYTTPGLYTPSVTITDDDTGTDSDTCEGYIVVYDPSAGFVTGGGWIMSPAEAYYPDQSLSGKATFGFVSKYKKGATVPEGNTEFQFHAANLSFKSTSYEWLVVSGTDRATFKGYGTINGAGNYGFLLSVKDGSPDMFRIKIWEVGGDTVYDNNLGGGDDAAPATALGGGSIVIHTGKK